MDFSNKTVLITGSTAGIGKETALAFLEKGANVILNGRNNAKAKKVLEDFSQKYSSKVSLIVADVSKEEEIKILFSTIEEKFGHLDVLFNNAGIGATAGKKITEVDFEDWNKLLSVNAGGIFLSLKYGLPLVKNGGSVINMASIYGLKAAEMGISPYVASKFAVIGLSKTAALEYASKNIRVNTICPTFTYTELTAKELDIPEFRKEIEDQHPLGRIGSSRDMANTVLWLASNESSYITGQDFVVDGGFSL